MKANPGGQIASSEVVGRDNLISSFWDILERQSLVLSAERRMGKTCIIKKMQAEPPSDKLSIYHDLEKVRSPLEFVETVLQDVEEYLTKLRRTARKTRQLLTQLSGTEVMGVKLPEFAAHWKHLLTTTIADLVENQKQKVILFWDEVPYMLSNIGDKEAMEVLDTLRAIRQTYPDVRMVFTGSIGLHHVVGKLKEVGYSNEPINDMYSADVPALLDNDAAYLARCLLEGEQIVTSNVYETAAAIAQAVDGIPFYIHHLVLQLKMGRRAIEATEIDQVINECLLNPLNPWKMDHYRDRIDNYYKNEHCLYALNILDIFAVEDKSLLFDDLFNKLKNEAQTQDKEIARNVLRTLERDYYIVRQADRTYRFRYPLIKRYWNLLRG